MTDATIPAGWHMRCADEYGDCLPVYYVRADGARVCLANDDFWANPNLPGYRAWCAVQPNGRTLCYHKRRRGRLSPFGSLRRWKTPQAAMRALDREYPMVAPGEKTPAPNCRPAQLAADVAAPPETAPPSRRCASSYSSGSQ